MIQNHSIAPRKERAEEIFFFKKKKDLVADKSVCEGTPINWVLAQYFINI
jgi:hypothetical protein